MPDLNQEIWTGEVRKAFREPSESRGWGADPQILINNKQYPLVPEGVVDEDKVVSLDKFETKPSKITDDEARTLSYDKVATVVERHKLSMEDGHYDKGLWNIAPQTNAKESPVIQVGEANIIDGLLQLKKFFDKNKVPKKGRQSR